MRKEVLESALRMGREWIPIRTMSKTLNISISALYCIVDRFDNYVSEGGRASNFIKLNHKEEKKPIPIEKELQELVILDNNCVKEESNKLCERRASTYRSRRKQETEAKGYQ